MRGIESTVEDEAARAGWLYYVGRMTQDQIATELGVSRQRAQRLVSKAMAEGLIHVRLEHRIAGCVALEAELARRFDLRLARVAPDLGPGIDQSRAIAPVAAAVAERYLASPEPVTVALGTGRALRAMVEEMTNVDGEQHKLVSLIGNIAPDGTATNYDVIMRVAEKVRAPHYPMPLPVILESPEVRRMFYALPQVQIVAQLVERADLTLVGVGQMNAAAPIYVDGFISQRELLELQQAGAMGEIASWVFDSDGTYLDVAHNDRIGGLRAGGRPGGLVVGVASGEVKLPAIRAALKGRILNGLITGEQTARALLD
ncbi:MAG: sugar-binding domain-containing protein [Paracoccaceae bacterium]